MNLIRFLIEVIVAVVLIPVIAVQTAGATNISTTTKVIFALFEVFAAIGVLMLAAKEIGYKA